MEKIFAQTYLTVEDLRTVFPDWTDEKRNAFLTKFEDDIADHMFGEAVEYMRYLAENYE